MPDSRGNTLQSNSGSSNHIGDNHDQRRYDHFTSMTFNISFQALGRSSHSVDVPITLPPSYALRASELFFYAETGQHKRILALFNDGHCPDPDARDRKGRTALHIAAKYGHCQTALVLINVCHVFKDSQLARSDKLSSEPSIHLLEKRYTPLYLSVKAGEQREALTKLLVQEGCSLTLALFNAINDGKDRNQDGIVRMILSYNSMKGTSIDWLKTEKELFRQGDSSSRVVKTTILELCVVRHTPFSTVRRLLDHLKRTDPPARNYALSLAIALALELSECPLATQFAYTLSRKWVSWNKKSGEEQFWELIERSEGFMTTPMSSDLKRRVELRKALASRGPRSARVNLPGLYRASWHAMAPIGTAREDKASEDRIDDKNDDPPIDAAHITASPDPTTSRPLFECQASLCWQGFDIWGHKLRKIWHR